MSEILHVLPSHQLFESDQETEPSGSRKKSEGLKEAMTAFCKVWIDFLVKSLTIRTQVSMGIKAEIVSSASLGKLSSLLNLNHRTDILSFHPCL